jgi:hypothetical protein
MRFRLSIALLLSIVLIGSALWFRLAQAEKPGTLTLVTDTTADNSASAASAVTDLDNTDATDLVPKASTTTPPENLSTTDLISRSLLSDYIDLAANGEDTDDNLNTLANKYADQVPGLTTAKTLKASDIVTLDDSASNYQNYTNEFNKIHKAYADYLNSAKVQKKNITDLGPDLYFAARAFSTAYSVAADSLSKLPVPLSLASLHLELINTYYSSAAAMSAISKTENDSATAFAGLVTLSSNLKLEDELMIQIGETINNHGV